METFSICSPQKRQIWAAMPCFNASRGTTFQGLDQRPTVSPEFPPSCAQLRLIWKGFNFQTILYLINLILPTFPPFLNKKNARYVLIKFMQNMKHNLNYARVELWAAYFLQFPQFSLIFPQFQQFSGCRWGLRHILVVAGCGRLRHI